MDRYFPEMPSAALAWLLNRELSPKQTAVFVAPNESAARLLFEDCQAAFSASLKRSLKFFPELDYWPYTQLNPDPATRAQRLEILSELHAGFPLLVVASYASIARRSAPQSFFSETRRTLFVGEQLQHESFFTELSELGYEEEVLVESEGCFARRGHIIDLWPPQLDLPVRLELGESAVESIRNFQPASQRSSTHKEHQLREVVLTPVREWRWSQSTRRQALERFHGFADEHDIPSSERRSLIEHFKNGTLPSGADTFLPLFHERLGLCLDALPSSSLIVWSDRLETEIQAEKLNNKLAELHKNCLSIERVIQPQQIFADLSELQRGTPFVTPPPQISSNHELKIKLQQDRMHGALEHMIALLKEAQLQGFHIMISCHTDNQAKRMLELLKPSIPGCTMTDVPFGEIQQLSAGTVFISISRFSAGFKNLAEKIWLITDEEIFGIKKTKRVASKTAGEAFSSFSEIASGDFLVHQLHGIGRYKGLEHLTLGGTSSDYMLLEYLDGDKLYLPVYRLNLVQRYIGPGDGLPELDKLGGPRWQNIKDKVEKEVEAIAEELLKIYATREIQSGFAFPPIDLAYEEFSATFPYDETPDQQNAIDAVMQSMDDDKPMDRLVCGDVGYGKTEVAIRAAFRAINAGKQVALLVPTTVLAFQHFETLQKRFARTGARVAMMSRFRSTKELKETAAELARGQIDLVVGTHRLLQDDIKFRDLGLLIIDEEQRFGVKHKEKIKALKHNVDVLTLTATPIPRTLNLSLVGLRDISIIQTPPANRQSIATQVAPFNTGLIRHAIMQELERGGQVFFVHNRVQTIHSMHEQIKRAVPEARVIIGHGQMKDGELEQVMVDFLHQRFDVLLCSTIIESGLDIPNANTMIINRADMFGLSQLYQLRGRVGRSDRKAFAYLLLPEEGKITPIARRRLNTLQRYTELGSGFQIAMHDLEIRGSGNILGSSQSGHMNDVGYEMYTTLLERTIRKLRKQAILEDIDPELNMGVDAFLPADYIFDDGTRIDCYRRLANRNSATELDELVEEFEDRFGALPEPAQALIITMHIKLLAKQLRITQLTADGKIISCLLDKHSSIDVAKIIQQIASGSKHYQLFPPSKLLIHSGKPREKLERLRSIANELSLLQPPSGVLE